MPDNLPHPQEDGEPLDEWCLCTMICVAELAEDHVSRGRCDAECRNAVCALGVAAEAAFSVHMNTLYDQGKTPYLIKKGIKEMQAEIAKHDRDGGPLFGF